MGCPMCDWKTATLLLSGLGVVMFAPESWIWLGLAMMVGAWVWAMWPKKSCSVRPDGRRSCAAGGKSAPEKSASD